MGYENIESDAIVLGSNTIVVIFIQLNYMCDFPVKRSPNFLNNDKNKR